MLIKLKMIMKETLQNNARCNCAAKCYKAIECETTNKKCLKMKFNVFKEKLILIKYLIFN